MLVLDEVDVVRHQRMKVVPRELCVSLFVLLCTKDEGRFYLSFISSKNTTKKLDSTNALKGRVAVPGCIQRAGDWWKARMSTNREKKPGAARRNRFKRE